jgi:hypothetical protein
MSVLGFLRLVFLPFAIDHQSHSGLPVSFPDRHARA